jgi:hypothetical protein
VVFVTFVPNVTLVPFVPLVPLGQVLQQQRLKRLYPMMQGAMNHVAALALTGHDAHTQNLPPHAGCAGNRSFNA